MTHPEWLSVAKIGSIVARAKIPWILFDIKTSRNCALPGQVKVWKLWQQYTSAQYLAAQKSSILKLVAPGATSIHHPTFRTDVNVTTRKRGRHANQHIPEHLRMLLIGEERRSRRVALRFGLSPAHLPHVCAPPQTAAPSVMYRRHQLLDALIQRQPRTDGIETNPALKGLNGGGAVSELSLLTLSGCPSSELKKSSHVLNVHRSCKFRGD
jgi:hypothetical protein